MTQDDFVKKHRHELGGLVLDAAMHAKHGAELSLWLRGAYAKIDVLLRQAYMDAREQPAANGTPRKEAAK